MANEIKVILTYKFVESRRHNCDRCELDAYCHDIDSECELGERGHYKCINEEIEDGCED